MGYNNNNKNLLMIISILSTFFRTSFSTIDVDYKFGSTCINKTNELSNTFFHENLLHVFSQLHQNAPSPKNKKIGFNYSSHGGGADAAYGLAQCRQDISSRDCSFCLDQASKDLKDLCPTERNAIVWYNHCTIKYADADFLGKPDISKWVYYSKVGSPTGGPDLPAKATQFIDYLHDQIKPSKFYITTAQVGPLYGMTQCNRDIIDWKMCKNCVQFAAAYLKWQINHFHHTLVGQRLAFVSCSIRFDNVSFY